MFQLPTRTKQHCCEGLPLPLPLPNTSREHLRPPCATIKPILSSIRQEPRQCCRPPIIVLSSSSITGDNGSIVQTLSLFGCQWRGSMLLRFESQPEPLLVKDYTTTIVQPTIRLSCLRKTVPTNSRWPGKHATTIVPQKIRWIAA